MKKRTLNILAVTGLLIVLILSVLKGRHWDNTDKMQEEIMETEVDSLVEETSTAEQEIAEKTEEDAGIVAGATDDSFAKKDDTGNTGENENTGSNENTINTTIGNDLTHKESIVSNNGVEIPVLNKFNTAGLNPDCAKDDGMQDWFGYVGDKNAAGYQNITVCAEAMNKLTEVLNISGGFLPGQDHISFSFTDIYAETGDLELRRDFDNGYYTIGINYDMSDSELFYAVEDGKDVLTLLCSVISSTPSELAEFIYQESFVLEEPVTSETTWITAGDCLIQWGGYNGNDKDVLVYKVKAK